MVWLHGFAQDEGAFLTEVAPRIDAAMRAGILPPFIAISPDGSLEGEPCHAKPGSFFINSKAGAFEDYIMKDVLGFVCANYPIRPERQAHMLVGLSMGGFVLTRWGSSTVINSAPWSAFIRRSTCAGWTRKVIISPNSTRIAGGGERR